MPRDTQIGTDDRPFELVDQATTRFAADPERVFFVGFSNGGFMAYRMAFDYPTHVVGDETWKREWEGCNGDSRVGFWSPQGGLHFPTLRDAFGPAVLDFMLE